MISRLLLLTLRTFRRRRGYALVSGIGLTVALACAALVGTYIDHETSFDAFHPDADRIERIYRYDEDEQPPNPYPRVTAMLGQRLQERVTGLDAVSSLNAHNRPVFVQSAGESDPPERLRIERRRSFMVPTGDAFFDLFGGFQVIRGTRSAFQTPGDAAITRSLARRLFGTVEVVGRSFQLTTESANRPVLRRDRQKEVLTVRAVVEDVPVRSHLQFDVLYAIATDNFAPNWSGAHLYARFAPGADRSAILREVMPTYNTLFRPDEGWPDGYTGASEKLTDIHLHSTTVRALSPRGNPTYLWALAALALIILAVASVNHSNLIAVTYSERSREVGARKALGASPRSIVLQFGLEPVVLTLLCAPVALGLASALTPAFNTLMASSIAVPILSAPAWMASLLGAIVLGTIDAAALAVARKDPPTLLSGSDMNRETAYVRRGMIVAQFALFVMLSTGAVLMHQQMSLLQQTDLGFEPAGLGEIENGTALVGERREDGSLDLSTSNELKRLLQDHESVRAVSSGFSFLGQRPGRLGISRSGDAEVPTFDASWSVLSPDAFDLFGMSLAHGTYLDTPPEERRTGVAIVNDVALRELGCTTDALDACVLDTAFNDIENVPVVGVLNPVRLASMRYETPPAVFVTRRPDGRPSRYWHRIFVQFESPLPASQQRQIVAGAWSTVAPSRPMEYEAMTERIASFYKDDQRLRTLGVGLTGIALVLVLLGLVALASYLTRQRLQEIAIRKTLGATIPRLLLMLNREFATLTAVACVLGSVGGYVAVRVWLNRFATQITLSPLVFLLASITAMTLAMLAVSVQSLSATRVHPASVLRGE